MRPILQDIGDHLKNDLDIRSLTGGRIYHRPPRSEQDDTYLTFVRVNRGRNDVRNVDQFRFTVFSPSVADLEELAEEVIEAFDGNQKVLVGAGNEYYTIQFLNQTDSDRPLNNGMHWTMLIFAFYRTS